MGLFRNVITAAVLVASVAGVSQAQVRVASSTIAGTRSCFNSFNCTPATNSRKVNAVAFSRGTFNWSALTTSQTTTTEAFNFGTSPTPAPSSMALLGIGIIGLVPIVRRPK